MCLSRDLGQLFKIPHGGPVVSAHFHPWEITCLQTRVATSKVAHYGILCKLWQPGGRGLLSQMRGCNERNGWCGSGGAFERSACARGSSRGTDR